MSNAALTILAEDEQQFRESCRSFAEGRIKPLVRKMDEEAKLDHGIFPNCSISA
jgi:alkylation response protein AidB-like acyl-CoA dehydrogenase